MKKRLLLVFLLVFKQLSHVFFCIENNRGIEKALQKHSFKPFISIARFFKDPPAKQFSHSHHIDFLLANSLLSSFKRINVQFST